MTSTPVLCDYLAGEQRPLAQVIAEESCLPADDSDSTALARFALEAPRIARDQPDSTAALNAAFDLLEHGRQNTALA
ncbi:hypothetical protein AB0A77_20550 [Streptomyces varsoviensis]|uniref:hypothetical protein n=1 Tax=Streptomyces varsoviensis TaxID=67373 RepID=UPI003401C63E